MYIVILINFVCVTLWSGAWKFVYSSDLSKFFHKYDVKLYELNLFIYSGSWSNGKYLCGELVCEPVLSAVAVTSQCHKWFQSLEACDIVKLVTAYDLSVIKSASSQSVFD